LTIDVVAGEVRRMPAADRLHSLDALRAFALLLGIFFHGAVPYVENFPAQLLIWREPPSATLGGYFFVTHIFRMSLFFMVAGFFGRMVLERKGLRAFAKDRGKRIVLPLVAGLPIVLLLMTLLAVAGTVVRGGSIEELVPATASAQVPADGSFPWAHLWFLYYLLIFFFLALALRAMFRGVIDRGGGIRRMIDVVVRFALSGVWGAALIGLPLAAYYYNLDGWPSWTGLPAPLALLPQLSSIVGYGAAFGFGWLAHRQTDRLLALERQWLAFCVLAVALTAVSYYVAGATPRFEAYLEGRELMIYCAAYFVAMWCWIFGLTGAAVRFLSGESALRRYVADSSYWLYLMHLPVLAFFAALLWPVPLHWTIKYPLQVGATLVVLFVSYRYLVRSTFIGATLNGRRYPRGAAAAAPVAALPAVPRE
jgi:glucans biosynthesis protein C